MPLSSDQQAAVGRLQSFYEGNNPYNSVTNPGGFRQGGHVYNFVNALKDIALAVQGAGSLVSDAVAASANSPKAVRVDSSQTFTPAEKRQGKLNLGTGGQLLGVSAATTLSAGALNTDVYTAGSSFVIKLPAITETVNDDYINFFNIGQGTITIQHSDADSAGLYYTGASAASLALGPGQSLRVSSDTGNWICGFRAISPERSINVDAIQSLSATQRGNVRSTLKLESSAFVYSGGNRSLTKDDVGSLVYTDATQTITIPLFSDCVIGDQIEFYVAAGTLTLAQPAGNANPIGVPGGGGATVALTVGAYVLKRQDTAWRLHNAPNNSVLRTGDTMTGTLKVDSGTIQIGKTGTAGVAGSALWQFNHWTSGDLYIQKADGSNAFVLGANGAFSIPQFGDLNNRIETRAQAWAVNYYNQTVTSVRLTYGGDYGNDINSNGSTYWEPFGGGVCTGRMTYYSPGAGNGYLVGGMRFRYLQVYVPNSGWVTVGYA